MAAFFIAQYVVNDKDLYSEYSAGAGPTIAAHKGELVSFDDHEVVREALLDCGYGQT